MTSHLREPIPVPRWLFTTKYAIFILVGVAVVWASSPAVDEISPDWLTPIWGMGIIASAAFALVGSLRERFEPLERVAVVVLAALFVVFAIAPVVLVLQGDRDRTLYSVIALGFSLLPILRSVQLLRTTGLRK